MSVFINFFFYLHNLTFIELISPLEPCTEIPAPKKRIGVLISGSGSNLKALIDHTRNSSNNSQAEIVLVISNKPNALGLQKAQNAGIPTKIIEWNSSIFAGNREAYDSLLSEALEDAGVELVCLAGFMRILSTTFVRKWSGKLINVHPALLPAFPGMNTHARALEAGVQYHGSTVHFVDEGVDTGAIIRQSIVEVQPQDTVEILEDRVKRAEHKLYPQVMEMLARNKVKLGQDKKTHFI